MIYAHYTTDSGTTKDLFFKEEQVFMEQETETIKRPELGLI